MKKIADKEQGFSAVELMVTLVVGATMILAFYQVHVIVSRTDAQARQLSAANNLAYSNLRNYTVKPSFTCDATTDMTAPNNTPTGQTLYTKTSNNFTTLSNPVVETVKVYAPRGCDAGMPAKIESVVEYGNPSRKISLGTYVKATN
jgi:prepilin-type N-terminal cleavage/methylation domain-containing protein